MDVMNDPKIAEWFGVIEAAKSTQTTYMHFMTLFCECLQETPTELIEESIQEIKDGKLPGERKAVSYIARFKKCMADKGLADKSYGVGLAAVISFFNTFDIALSARIGKQRKRDALHENKNYLTKEDVKFIIENAGNPREKAIVQLMATSGLARREIINLRIREIT